MRTMRIAIIALVSALSALSTFQASGAGTGSLAIGRDAAISRCLAQAHSHYPGKYWDWGQARGFAYRTCIFGAGYPP
jgi:hypothetical protein